MYYNLKPEACAVRFITGSKEEIHEKNACVKIRMILNSAIQHSYRNGKKNHL
jgi:hypothetical protein